MLTLFVWNEDRKYVMLLHLSYSGRMKSDIREIHVEKLVKIYTGNKLGLKRVGVFIGLSNTIIKLLLFLYNTSRVMDRVSTMNNLTPITIIKGRYYISDMVVY